MDKRYKPGSARQLAKAAGLLTYNSGKPCKNGHVCERYVNTKHCVECTKLRDFGRERSGDTQNYYVNNKHLWVERRKKNRDKIVARRRELYNTEKNKIARRSEVLRAKYGLTYEQYMGMFEVQDNSCQLCFKRIVPYSSNRCDVAHVDHCHKTGRVRGLLCSSCNTAIGHLKEDIDVLKRAILYLS